MAAHAQQPNIRHNAPQPNIQLQGAGIIRLQAPTVSQLPVFDPHEEKFSTWFQLFHEYCFLNGIPEEPEMQDNVLPPHNRRRALFLSHIGTRTLEILNKKCSPYPPNRFPVQALANTLTLHFERPELQSTYRYQFSNRIQQLNESVSDFATELQDLGAKCGFGAQLEDRLRDRFVSGAVLPQPVRSHLIANPQMPMEEMVHYAIQAEQLEQQAKMYARNLQLQQITVATIQQQEKARDRSKLPQPLAVAPTYPQQYQQSMYPQQYQQSMYPQQYQQSMYPQQYQQSMYPQQYQQSTYQQPCQQPVAPQLLPHPSCQNQQIPQQLHPTYHQPVSQPQLQNSMPRHQRPMGQAGYLPSTSAFKQVHNPNFPRFAQPSRQEVPIPTQPQRQLVVDRRRGQCDRCGNFHDYKTCVVRSMCCNYCGKRGHLSKVCHQRLRDSNSSTIHNIRDEAPLTEFSDVQFDSIPPVHLHHGMTPLMPSTSSSVELTQAFPEVIEIGYQAHDNSLPCLNLAHGPPQSSPTPVQVESSAPREERESVAPQVDLNEDDYFIQSVLSQIPTLHINCIRSDREEEFLRIQHESTWFDEMDFFFMPEQLIEEAFEEIDEDLTEILTEAAEAPTLFGINNYRVSTVSNSASSDPLEIKPSPPEMVQVFINQVEFMMELDAGAAVSILPYGVFKANLPSVPLRPASISLSGLSGGINVKGAFIAQARLGSQELVHKLPIVVAEAPPSFHPLLGRDWLDVFLPHWRSTFRASIPVFSVTTSIVDQLKARFERVFDPTNDDPIKVGEVSLLTVENFKPVFHNAYPVPFARIATMDKILDDLLEKDRIYPVRSSSVASPVVMVPKKSGDIRMCPDLKRTVNPQLRTDHYKLPVPNDFFAAMAHGTCFTVLDLSDAYTQIEVDEASQELLTINTHRGLFRYRRLIYGISSAPCIFQRTMDSILHGIPNVCCYIDDILIKGQDFPDCFRTVCRVLERLVEYNVRLKPQKCRWFEPEVEYLGHILSASGRRPAPSKVESIRKMKTPSNVKEVRHILGVLEFYAQYFSHCSTILKPLSALTKADTPFHWTEECDTAFNFFKDTIKDKILIHYDPELPLLLMTDASPVGLGVALCHEVIVDGKVTEMPILFASCTLSESQSRYSQIDREALAVIFGIRKCHKYLYGRKFKIVTDNSAISYIFSPSRPMPVHTANRLLNWSYLLAAYSFEIVHRKAALLCVPDALSRLPAVGVINDIKVQTNFEGLPLTCLEIAQESAKDPLVSKVIELTHQGWPSSNDPQLTDPIKPFYQRRFDLSISDGCLLCVNRVFIPPSLRAHVLKLLHEGHPGVVRSKMLARRTVYWFGIDKDLEVACENCTVCKKVNFKPPKDLIPWPEAKFPFERVHLDFCQLQKTNYLVLVDAFSKWLHTCPMATTTAGAVKTELLSVFATWGLPHLMVADNGPPFDSAEFKDFCTTYNVTLLNSPAYHPESNGLGERAVQVVKKGLRKLFPTRESESTGDAARILSMFLFAYRNTPSTTTGKTPNELLLSYTPRTLLTQLHPTNASKNKSLEKQDLFRENDVVLIKAGKQPPITAKVIRRLSATRYLVSAHGVFKKPHINQMSHATVH